jgi:P27 family predicted phage terminase small subunit
MKGGARHNKPAAIRALHGSKTRPRHAHVPEAPPVAELPPPPGLTPLERQHWEYYAPKLAAIRVLSALDLDALQAFCVAAAQMKEIRAQQQTPGYRRVIKNRTHALDAQLRSWLPLLRMAASELGLSPMSRARVAPAAPKEEADALDDFITAPIHAVK